MDRTCSGSDLTIGCYPKYLTRVSLTCVQAYSRQVLRIETKVTMLYFCGAAGESLDRSKLWETAAPACRDQRTRRWSHTRGARVKSTKAHRTSNIAIRSAQLIRSPMCGHEDTES